MLKRGMEMPLEGSRIEKAEAEGWSESWSAYNNERTWIVLDVLHAVAEESGKQPAQVALNWVLQRPGITAPIIGARNLDQLESNLGASGWSMSEDQMTRLNQVSAMELPYPYDFINDAQSRR